MHTCHMATSSKPASLFETILRGNEHTNSVIILDSVKADGCASLKTLVSQFACQSIVHLFLLASYREEWLSLFKTSSQLISHDYYTDPLGWSEEAGSEARGCLSDMNLQHCLELVGGAKGVVVFDNLTPLLLHQSSPVVTRLLHGISQRCGLVLSLVHADLHDDHVISQLCHVTCTSIMMQPLPPHVDKPYLCSIHHKRKSGKVTKQTETLSISHDYSTLSSSLHEPFTQSTPSTHTPSQADPSANLSFDLTLTAKEKRDRANVILPYTRPHISLAKGEGQIFYQPDEADDFDESDPDDDLDI